MICVCCCCCRHLSFEQEFGCFGWFVHHLIPAWRSMVGILGGSGAQLRVYKMLWMIQYIYPLAILEHEVDYLDRSCGHLRLL